MKVLTLCGSLRQASFNRQLLAAARQAGPAGIEWVDGDVAGLPLYNEELDGEQKPAAVARLRQQVTEADALLIATPEYNYSIPGGLKNAIDWISRPGFKSPMVNKPVAILTASMSPVGGARAQTDLKHVLQAILARAYPVPEFLLPQAHQAFDEHGRLSDENTQRLTRFLQGFHDWVGKR